MATTTDMIWRASSRDGARHSAFVVGVISRRLNISATKSYLGLILGKINTAQHRQNKSSCFPCAGLRLTDHVRWPEIGSGWLMVTVIGNITHGLDSRRGNARSWILEGLENPMS